MKKLTTYIIEKLDIDKISLNDKFGDEFKKVFDFNDTLAITKWLEKQGFIQVQLSMAAQSKDVLEYYNDCQKKCFSYDDDGKRIIIDIVDTSKSKISDHNPLFTISYMKDYKLTSFSIMTPKGITPIEDIKHKCDINKFADLLNKRFGWK